MAGWLSWTVNRFQDSLQFFFHPLLILGFLPVENMPQSLNEQRLNKELNPFRLPVFEDRRKKLMRAFMAENDLKDILSNDASRKENAQNI